MGGAHSGTQHIIVSNTQKQNIITKLPIPYFQERQTGQVIITLKVTNRIEEILAERGFISPAELRSLELTDVLVDTGTTLLCLLSSLINQLGLVPGRQVTVETSSGVKKCQIFRDVELCIEGRRSTFSCLEPTEVSYALLGIIPIQVLGLELDFKNQKLRLLPMNSEQSYIRA